MLGWSPPKELFYLSPIFIVIGVLTMTAATLKTTLFDEANAIAIEEQNQESNRTGFYPTKMHIKM